jgi:tetratricopeptide (TPR) repeat protein
MATETESPDRRERGSANQIDSDHWSEKADRWWNLGTKWLLRIIATLTFLGVIYLLCQAFDPSSVVIRPISVPKDMADKGFTPDVAALRLLEAVTQYTENARTSGAGPKFAPHFEPADFVIPSVGLSFKAVVAQIRTLLPISGNQIISGEITRVDGKLRLLLRKNEAVIHDSSERADDRDLEDLGDRDLKDLNALKALFENGALGVFAGTRPYFEAIAMSEKNPEVAFKLASRIIADGPSGDDIVWARNLLGLLLYQKGHLEGAVTAFKRAFNDDPGLAVAHLNLGLAYVGQGRAKDAIVEFRSAIRLAPELGIAHLKLGDVLDQTGDVEGADCEYLKAIAKFHRAVASDQLSGVAHQHLGDALKNKDRAEKANCAFQDKRILMDRSRYDNAVAEYQRATERKPYDAHIRYDLASEMLESPDLTDKSIRELQKALDHHESPQEARKRREGLPSESFDEFKYVLLTTLSHAKRLEARNDKAITDCEKHKFEHEEDELFCQAFRDNEALIKRAEEKTLIDKEPNDNAAAYKRRGVNYYLMGKSKEAVKAHNKALDIDNTYLAAKVGRGYAWFASGNERAAEDFNGAANDFDDAADDFNRATEFSSASADTMLWRYLSREHSRIVFRNKYYQQKVHKEELSNASKLLGPNHEDWRIKLFKDNQLPEGVRKPDDVLRNEKRIDKQCKMYFYIGEWHSVREEREAAVEWLKQAATTCPFGLVERPAATAELGRLEPLPGGAMGASPGVSTNRRRSRR